jgi:Domain of unknown function (DUF4259)
MGFWDTGPFDNDTAADFAGELDELPEGERPSAIQAALEAAVEAEDLDDRTDLTAIAIAAVALVVAQCPNGEPTDPIYGPEQPIPQLSTDLRLLAMQALDRVENSTVADWHTGSRRLRVPLAAALEDPNQLKLPIDL